MFWVAALLALIIWVLGMASGFLGLRIHLFLLFTILAILAALLPAHVSDSPTTDNFERAPNSVPNAKSVPGVEPAERGEGCVRTPSE